MVRTNKNNYIITYAEKTLIEDALRDAQTEFEELMHEKEWFVTEVVDKLASAIEILENAKQENNPLYT